MVHKARLTLDMSSDEHAYLKIACAKLGMTMREFIFLASAHLLLVQALQVRH